MQKLLLILSLWIIHPVPKDPVVYTINDLLGDIDPSRHSDFQKVKRKYTIKEEAYLRKEVYDAFRDMWKEARKAGIDLTIISATRNREYQEMIWNRKWEALQLPDDQKAAHILQYSSMPGISRHHWGTDFDLNALENSYFENGQGKKVYEWLTANAHKYGFFQPYTTFNNFRDKGYKEEKWHWSYYPLAKKFHRAYSHLITYDNIRGFKGSEFARELNVIENYVNGIEVPAILQNF